MIDKTYFLRLMNDFLLPWAVPTEHLLKADYIIVAQVVFNEFSEPLVLVVSPTIRDAPGSEEQVIGQKA